jgi:DNA (cytosine-5)-methyltransferase 1
MNKDGLAHQQHPLREMALFAGAGGGILGGKLLGWETVCAVEWEPYPCGVLIARQNEGILSPFPIWDDVQTFDGRPWRGLVDVVSGGFPCQDISAAGKGAGITGERSGMWSHMARIIGEVRPRFAFVENSPMLTSRGLGTVLGDLAELGYDAEWCVLGADDAGAPHRRKRIWILAHTTSERLEGAKSIGDKKSKCEWTCNCSGQHPIGQLADTDLLGCVHGQVGKRTTEGRFDAQCEPEPSGEDVSYTNSPAQRGGCAEFPRSQGQEAGWGGYGLRGVCWGWWSTEPNVGRVAHGVASRVDELKALGNGQVSSVVRIAWNTLHERIGKR